MRICPPHAIILHTFQTSVSYLDLYIDTLHLRRPIPEPVHQTLPLSPFLES